MKRRSFTFRLFLRLLPVLALAAMASGGDITLAALRQARANLGGQE